MSWRSPTESDLIATLSREEVESFRVDGDATSDPVESILAATVEMVRGKCATNRNCKICPTPGTIPASLVSAAMAFASFDVLTRFGVAVSEDRRRKRDWAEKQFDAVAAGSLAVEGWEEDATSSPLVAGTPSYAPATPARLLD